MFLKACMFVENEILRHFYMVNITICRTENDLFIESEKKAHNYKSNRSFDIRNRKNRYTIARKRFLQCHFSSKYIQTLKTSFFGNIFKEKNAQGKISAK